MRRCVHTHVDSDLNARLSALHPTIHELISVAGTVGLSLGVVHNDKLIHTANFGFRDHASKLPINDETIFPGCSLTKAMLSATLGVLVEEGALTWETRLKDVLPAFHIRDQTLQDGITITDLLAHRTGMSASNYWLGSQNNILIAKDDSLTFLNNQQAVKPFRGQWQYNNLGYELAGLVIEQVTGHRWDKVLGSKILDPLGLTRTNAMPKEKDGNTAKAYAVLDDYTPIEIAGVKAAANTFGGANGGIRSCVKDLLKLYQEFMRASKHQFSTGQTSTPGSPLNQVAQLLSSKIPLKETSLHENSYAFGWVRSQLPSPMGAIGLNGGLMPNGMPIVGKGGPSCLIFYHQGSHPGALAAVNLLPETQSAIVVMTNTLALNDCADWVGQLVLEELIETKEKNDYLELARRSVTKSLAWQSTVEAALKKNQAHGTSPRNLDEYTGSYINSIKTMRLEVTQEDDKLFFALQGLESEKFELTHYQDDIFTWLRPRNELAGRGRFTHQGSLYYLLRFSAGDDDKIGKLAWAHDADIPDGEIFEKAS